jgi:hypothetical protein
VSRLQERQLAAMNVAYDRQVRGGQADVFPVAIRRQSDIVSNGQVAPLQVAWGGR